MYVGNAPMQQRMCGSQRKTGENQVSPPIMWVSQMSYKMKFYVPKDPEQDTCINN